MTRLHQLQCFTLLWTILGDLLISIEQQCRKLSWKNQHAPLSGVVRASYATCIWNIHSTFGDLLPKAWVIIWSPPSSVSKFWLSLLAMRSSDSCREGHIHLVFCACIFLACCTQQTDWMPLQLYKIAQKAGHQYGTVHVHLWVLSRHYRWLFSNVIHERLSVTQGIC